MPKVSLVVCLYKERDLLARLLHHAEGCYDDLVVVHDGSESETSAPIPLADVHIPSHRHPELAVDFSKPDEAAKASLWWKTPEGIPNPGSIHELVAQHGGRYFEGPRCWQQEPHWPFAWSVAKHNWIFRMDADEYPSKGLIAWLKSFKTSMTPESQSYTALWPPWSGSKIISTNIPTTRLFLFNKQSASFWGMAEHSPEFDLPSFSVPHVINHTPRRKSIGPGNLLFRRQARVWRKVISLSLIGGADKLPRWRSDGLSLPPYWQEVVNCPLKTGLVRFVCSVPREYIYMRRNGYDFILEAALGTALHKLLVPLAYWYYKTFHNLD